MHSMASLPSAMLVRPGNLKTGGVGRACVRVRAPGVALRGSRVMIAVRREVYRSGFLPRGLVVQQRRPAVFGRGAIVSDKRPSFVVRAAGENSQGVEEDAGSREVFENSDGSSLSEAEILAPHDNLMTVEEIEVSGPSGFSENSVASFDDVELETDVVHQSTRQQPKLVKFLRKVWRALQGLKEKEDAVLELSSSVKDKKLRWNPLGFLNGSTPSATEKLRNKVFDGLRRAEDDFFAVCGVACHASFVCIFAEMHRLGALPCQTLIPWQISFLLFISVTSSDLHLIRYEMVLYLITYLELYMLSVFKSARQVHVHLGCNWCHSGRKFPAIRYVGICLS